MNFFYTKMKSLALFIAFLTCVQIVNAQQQGRLPTAQELSMKENLFQLYKSSSMIQAVPNHIMVTGPEQNCSNAIPVCQQSYTQTSSYMGSGTIQEVNSGTCLLRQESNSVWYVFTVQNSGTFSFLLNTANDYDFGLYDITSIGCSGVPSAVPVRCNFSATYGSTGLTLPVSATMPLSAGAGASPTMPGINVNAGQTFALIIDNFSANTNGYSLTFGGTAQIFDNIAPTISSSSFPCNGSSVRLNFSEPVACSSINSNGSDFTLAGPSGSVPITTAVGNLCSTGASNTNFVTVNFNNSGLPSGTYTISVNPSGGNTLNDKCGNVMAAQSFTFQYLAPITISATSTIVCASAPTTLSVTVPGNPSGVTYLWAPGGAVTPSITINPNLNVTYGVSVSYGGCTRSASQLITVAQAPVVSVNPNNISLCSGTTNISASATINFTPCANCSYTWTGSSSQVNNSVPGSTITGASAGSYSVTIYSSLGCKGNTAVSNVAILSPSSTPACNIIYASPAGGGTGITPGSPTDIVTALTMAACNNIVIKMQVVV
jgi:hypothetical protein